MNKLSLLIIAFLVCSGFTASMFLYPSPYDRNTAVSSVLMALGEDAPEHYIGSQNMDKIGKGKDFIQVGGPYMYGNIEYRLSEHFICIDCHNVLPEAPFADDNDPDSRLKYSMEFNQRYLPGSTFYGITNRTSWFNGDYKKKYGKEAIEPVSNDLKAAIQFCSKEVSIGRELAEEEMDVVLHYLNALELKMKDLNLSEEELEQVSAIGQTTEEKAANVALLKSKYLQGYPATFTEAIPTKKRKMGKEDGDLKKGKWIYEKSCLHCHSETNTVTDKTIFGYGTDQKNFNWLAKYFKKSNGSSVYWITRHGTESTETTPQYMPRFSKEKMSDSQIEDLAAYILAESKK